MVFFKFRVSGSVEMWNKMVWILLASKTGLPAELATKPGDQTRKRCCPLRGRCQLTLGSRFEVVVNVKWEEFGGKNLSLHYANPDGKEASKLSAYLHCLWFWVSKNILKACFWSRTKSTTHLPALIIWIALARKTNRSKIETTEPDWYSLKNSFIVSARKLRR